ncbi:MULTISPECIES: cytochrome c biogenesis CcdA family protein [Shimia]|uniref:cytochrome c biogenesis CcdA family protein n=1 Tax=Shimia TaxID=573139 RepID=UPI001FB3CD60|nr:MULTISPECIES: cytochrome c biogenesis CcdA family protein [Shimia]MDV4144569.1 cytochrome c biogenesis CcdA family protein [Shimia sp. FJ5]
MELVFAYAAGLLTLINPCVLPVLPIVLATALQASRHGPAFLALGMSLSFVVLGLGVTAFGYALGLTQEDIAKGGAALMVAFGLVLLVPRFSAAFTTATAGVAASADSGLDTVDRSTLRGQFLGGMLLGAVWSPCVGPTLGGAISLASQGNDLFWAGLIMVAFALGVSTIILVLGYGARSALQRRQALMRRIAHAARPAMGVVFVAVGLALLFNLHHMVEAWLLGVMPDWLLNLSVSL